MDSTTDKTLAANNAIGRGQLLRDFLKQLSDKFTFIEKETNAVLDERDAQSLLLDRIQYYVNMGNEPGSEGCDVQHAFGHIAQELKEYAEHHLLGTFPPCVVQVIDGEQVFLRDGSQVVLAQRSADVDGRNARFVVGLEVVPPPNKRGV